MDRARPNRSRIVTAPAPPAVLATIFAAAACAPTADPGPVEDPLRSIETRLEQAVAEDDTLPGASIYVVAPSLEIDWGVGVGIADSGGAIAFTPEHPVRISSVTKPFVAASILRLHEQGRLELDTPISAYLNAEHIEILQSGDVDPSTLTIRHLLTHTSGLLDFFYTSSFQQYFEGVLQGAKPKSFTLEDQLRGSMEGGATTGAPGERQRYSDTGYILLGAILEELTGENIATAVRRLSRYGDHTTSTWWEVYEQPPSGALRRAAQYFGNFEGDGFGEQPFDLYGGGGMISTTKDLATYFWALFHGQVFDEPSTLATMMAKAETQFETEGPLVVRHGLQEWTIDGRVVYGHGGWWGVSAYYAPETEVLVAVNWLQQHAGSQMGAIAQEIVTDLTRAAAAIKGKAKVSP